MARATTTCPSCGTTFRVKPDQLAARHGQVRCGHCRLIFNGFATLSVGADTQTGKNSTRPGSAAGAATPDARHHRTTLRPGDAAKRLRMDVGVRRAQPVAGQPASEAAARGDDTASPDRAHDAARSVPELLPLDLAPPPTVLGSTARMVGILGAALLAGLALALVFRAQVVKSLPGLAEPIAAICRTIGCTLPLAQDADQMSIETSELRADPDHSKTLLVVATLRNRAHFAQAYPALELTLTDAQDATLVKRRILPADYLPRGTDVATGIASNAEANIRLSVGADDGRAVGYRLYLYYP